MEYHRATETTKPKVGREVVEKAEKKGKRYY